MKFTVEKEIFKNAFTTVQGLTGRRTNLSITECVLIRATDTGITLTATDLETGFEGSYPAEVEAEGTIAINAKKVHEIIKLFPDAEISFSEQDKRWIKIGNHNIEYNIVGLNPDDFPSLPEIKSVEFIEISENDLKRLTEHSLVISGASDDKRAHINGVLIERLNTTLRIVSTDGSRLSKTDCYVENLIEAGGVIIPKKGLSEIGKNLRQQETVQIGIKDNHFILKNRNETFTIRLLEGDFPKYNDIISKKDGGITVNINRRLLLAMLKRMSILSSDNYRGVTFCFGNNKLKITATNPDIGESKEEMDIEFVNEPIETAFNPKYFIDTLNMIDENTVCLNIIDDRRPCIVEGENNKNYLTVIMPMRI